MIRNANNRFLQVAVGALVSYALLETFVAYVRERREQLARSRGWLAFIRDRLVSEEMTVRQPTTVTVAVADDCGCTDAS